ncbi:MAG: 3-isopropylmalate dehydratase small subunit [Actinobacteria bacterium]|nr:3-isopropylmalate dehydratase small subunit [Actinomycetota bacterium]
MRREPFTTIEGEVSTLLRDDVDTDQIIPKQFLKFIFTTGYEDYAFFQWRKEGLDLPRREILVAGRNFGCGSSREQAAWALRDYGFKVIIAPSFGDIFHNNWIQNGCLPVTLDVALCESLVTAGRAEVDLQRQLVSWATGEAEFTIDAHAKHLLAKGLDEIAETLIHLDTIEAYERTRPLRYPKTRTPVAQPTAAAD